MKENTQKLFYTVITDQTLSSNGRFLYVCSNFGDIATYNLDKITSCIENISSEDISEPISIFKCPNQMPLSLAFHRDFLIVGCDNANIFGFETNPTSSTISPNASWKIQLPIALEQFEISEVNDMWIDAENETLYAACGNSVFKCNLEDGSILQKFEGHTDYIHSVSGCGNNIVTASEDGHVKLWDNRQKKATASIEPVKNQNLVRKKLGKWQGSASISKEWLACGGATKLALFHISQINARQPFHIFEETELTPIHVTEFVDTDSLLVAGESSSVMQFSLKGNMISEMESSGPAVYSVVWQKKPNKFLSMCGASNRIDISTNFTYKDTTLSFYKREKN